MWNISFVCAILGQFLSYASSNVTNPLITSYADFLGADAVTVGIITGMTFGVANLMRIFAGPAIVKMNNKRLLLCGFSMGVAVNVMYALSGTVPLFVAARFFQGVQFSIMGPLLMTLTGDSLPEEKLGSGIAVFTITGIIAGAVGPALGLSVREVVSAHFGDAAGFRAIFLLSAAIQLVALVPTALIKTRGATKQELQSAGVWYKNIISVAALPPALCLMFNFVSFSLFNAYLVPYAAEKGFSGIAAFFTIYAAGTILARFPAGRLIARFGEEYVIYPSLLIYIASFFTLWQAGSMAMVYLSAALAAFGFGSTFPVFQALSVRAVPLIKRGVASSTSFIGIDTGQFLGPVIGGALINRFAATGHAYSTLYLFAPVSVLVTAVLYTATKKYVKCRIDEIEFAVK